MKRITAIFFLFVFLSGQIDLTWADHYCGKRVVKSALMLGHGHLDCGMTDMMSCDTDISDFESHAFKPVNCCTNSYFSSDSDEYFSKSETSVQQLPAVSITFTYVLFDHIILSDDIKYSFFPGPPLIQTDRVILNRVFLI
jgi:hypothetical protein